MEDEILPVWAIGTFDDMKASSSDRLIAVLLAVHPDWTLPEAISWIDLFPEHDEEFFEWECHGPKLDEYIPWVRRQGW